MEAKSYLKMYSVSEFDIFFSHTYLILHYRYSLVCDIRCLQEVLQVQEVGKQKCLVFTEALANSQKQENNLTQWKGKIIFFSFPWK